MSAVVDQAGSETAVQPRPHRCANCSEALDGRYCSHCGQQAIDLHRPFRQWISQLIDDAFYRRQGYYLDHLVFSLYYHAFVFIVFAAMFILSRSAGVLPDVARATLGMGLFAWLIAYLPLALRRVYGGSWVKTLLKLAALGVLYFFVFFLVQIPLIVYVVLSTF